MSELTYTVLSGQCDDGTWWAIVEELPRCSLIRTTESEAIAAVLSMAARELQGVPHDDAP